MNNSNKELCEQVVFIFFFFYKIALTGSSVLIDHIFLRLMGPLRGTILSSHSNSFFLSQNSVKRCLSAASLVRTNGSKEKWLQTSPENGMWNKKIVIMKALFLLLFVAELSGKTTTSA